MSKLYPQLNHIEWAEQYQIDLEPVDCPKCKAQLNFTVPYAIKGYRGLAVKSCSECKFDSGIKRYVPVSEEKKSLWDNIKYYLQFKDNHEPR